MKKIVFAGVMSCICVTAFARITIGECHRKAQANYPLIQLYDLIEKTREFNLANANKGYLPQITFSAKATAQSDVTQIPFDFSRLGIQGLDVPSPRKDQYGATLDVNQTVWDGGAIGSRKENIRTAAEVEKAGNRVQIYAVVERVNQLYFGILLADARIRQNRLLQDDLRRNCEQVRSYMRNGIANQSDLDAIQVELLRAEQNGTQLAGGRRAYVEMLSRLIGEELDADTEFVRPESARPLTQTVDRPELDLFAARIRNLEAKNRVTNAALMPRLGVFVTGGYGNPGLNMLKDEFSAYWVAGARITWNIGGLYTRRADRRIIRTEIRSVEAQRETFLFDTGLDLVQKNNAIDNYIDLLRYDDRIIALRGSVRRASEAKMANGTISGSDLARDIDAEQMALRDRSLHEIELLLAIYELKFAINNP